MICTRGEDRSLTFQDFNDTLSIPHLYREARSSGYTYGMKYKGKILVVDADPASLGCTRARLEGVGFEVVTSNMVLRTLVAIISEEPDLVLLDLNMPAPHNAVLLEVLNDRSWQDKIPIVVCSDDGPRGRRHTADELEALGSIQKTASEASFISQFCRLYSRAKRREVHA
jgi:CheY-like chemotaxis protein